MNKTIKGANKGMNGFILMADSYRKAADEGKISKEQAEKQARVYDFLGTCDREDFFILFDSSAFNEISKSYLRLAVKNLIEKGMIEEEQGTAIRNEFSILFDEKRAAEV